VTISAELEFYPHITSKSEFKVTVRSNCTSGFNQIQVDNNSSLSEKPYKLYPGKPYGLTYKLENRKFIQAENAAKTQSYDLSTAVSGTSSALARAIGNEKFTENCGNIVQYLTMVDDSPVDESIF